MTKLIPAPYNVSFSFQVCLVINHLKDMIDLTSVSSLPIQFDVHTSTFIINEPLSCTRRRKVQLSKLTPALLNRSLKYPEEVYEEFCGLFFHDDRDIFEEKLHYEVLYLPPGLLGIEFIKSHVYYCEEKGKYSAVVECLYGILTVVIQRNAIKDDYDFDTTIEEGVMVNLRKGDKIAIPTGFFYTFINTKNTAVIFSRVYKNKGIADYSRLEREQGLGYFAIRKNARTEIVFNPRYKQIPKITKFTPSHDRFCVGCGKEPLYQAVRKNPALFLKIVAET